jgi:hypothetical protein
MSLRTFRTFSSDVLDDRGNEQRKHHRGPRARADLQNELNRHERNNAEGGGAARGEHPEQVPASRPDNHGLSRQRVGVDDGGDRVRGIVETIDEFKAQHDQHRDAEQQERQIIVGPARVSEMSERIE